MFGDVKKIVMIAGPSGARVSLGGHRTIPRETIERRLARGKELLRSADLEVVGERSIYDASRRPPTLREKRMNEDTDRRMETTNTKFPDT